MKNYLLRIILPVSIVSMCSVCFAMDELSYTDELRIGAKKITIGAAESCAGVLYLYNSHPELINGIFHTVEGLGSMKCAMIHLGQEETEKYYPGEKFTREAGRCSVSSPDVIEVIDRYNETHAVPKTIKGFRTCEFSDKNETMLVRTLCQHGTILPNAMLELYFGSNDCMDSCTSIAFVSLAAHGIFEIATGAAIVISSTIHHGIYNCYLLTGSAANAIWEMCRKSKVD